MAVSEEARKSVVFLAHEKDGQIEPRGTGFLVHYDDEDGHRSRYLVTCRHVAKHLEKDFFIRANTVARVAEDLPIGGDQACWQYHPDTTVDIAATMIGLNARHFDHLTLPLEKRTKPDDVGCGQRVHIIGLFRLHRGQKRNVPIVHTGHIAALPDPSEKIAVMDRATGEPVGAESYLVEAQTLEGLSGSPVFVQGYVAWRGQAAYEDTVLHTPIAAFGEVKLLGVYQAAWDGQRGAILEADRDFKGKLRVPVGMGIVVPIEKVIELIEENSNLKQWRQQRKEAERAGRATS